MFEQLAISADIKVYHELDYTVCYIIKYKGKMRGDEIKV